MKWFRRYIEKIAAEVAEKLIKEHDMARRENVIFGNLTVEGTLTTQSLVEAEGGIRTDTVRSNGIDGLTLDSVANVTISSSDGEITIPDLVSTDPGIEGRVWADADGFLKRSEGS